MTTTYVALGANLGDRLETIRSAIGDLAGLGRIVAVSSIYETDPVGYADQPPYLNAVAALETRLDAARLLDALQVIEQHHGRVRTFPNAPRTLDLDLLLFGDDVRATELLTIPHPRLHERAFVLVPLNEIAPNVSVPGLDATVSGLLSRLGPISGVHRFAPPVAARQT